MDPNNPRWMTADERRQRSARMWKVIVAALSGATFATVVVASCLDRDEDARLDEPGVTQTTAADLPPGGVGSASTTDTSSGVGHGAAGVPADQGRDANPTTDETTTPTPNESTTDSSTGAPRSKAPVLIQNVENMSVHVTNMSTLSSATTQSDAAQGAGAPIAGHASHQDNDPNALVARGLANTASGVATATSDDGGVPPPATYWTPAGPYIMHGVQPAGATTAQPPAPAAPTTQPPSVQGGAPMRGGAPVQGGTPPSAPSPTTPMVQPMR